MYTVISDNKTYVFHYISDAAQFWSDQQHAVVLDKLGYEISEEELWDLIK